jgi:hypothetical protein
VNNNSEAHLQKVRGKAQTNAQWQREHTTENPEARLLEMSDTARADVQL